MNEKSLQNLKHDSESKRKAAKSKKGTQYYATKLKEQFIKSRNLKESLRLAQKREKQLMQIAAKEGLDELQIKELNVIQKYTSKFLDKTIATKFESDNKHEVNDRITIVTVQPDDDGKR